MNPQLFSLNTHLSHAPQRVITDPNASLAALFGGGLAAFGSPAFAATTTMTTQASAGIPLGGVLFDTALVKGRTDAPAGAPTVRFRLYGPASPDCTVVLATWDVAAPMVGADVNVASPAYVPAAPGTHRWTAEYLGDTAEHAVVSVAQSSVATTASPGFVLGTANATLTDTATVTGVTPTGAVTFNLYGPDNTNCTGTPVYDRRRHRPEQPEQPAGRRPRHPRGRGRGRGRGRRQRRDVLRAEGHEGRHERQRRDLRRERQRRRGRGRRPGRHRRRRRVRRVQLLRAAQGLITHSRPGRRRGGPWPAAPFRVRRAWSEGAGCGGRGRSMTAPGSRHPREDCTDMKHPARFLALLTAGALALGGCGKGDSGGDSKVEALADGDEGTVTFRGSFANVEDAPEDTAEVTGLAEMVVGNGRTTVDILVSGLTADTTYYGTVNSDKCSASDPGGGIYRFDPDGPDEHPNVVKFEMGVLENKDTKLAAGSNAEETYKKEAGPAAKSVVIALKRKAGEKDDEKDLPKIACADLQAPGAGDDSGSDDSKEEESASPSSSPSSSPSPSKSPSSSSKSKKSASPSPSPSEDD